MLFGNVWTNSTTIWYKNCVDHYLPMHLTRDFLRINDSTMGPSMAIIHCIVSELVSIKANQTKQKNTATQGPDSLLPAFIHRTNKVLTQSCLSLLIIALLTTAGVCSDCKDPTLQATIVEELNDFK